MAKKTDKRPAAQSANRSYGIAAAIYWLLLAVYLIASYMPEVRLWGVNWWAYFPVWARLIMLAIGVGLGIGLPRYLQSRQVSASEEAADPLRTYLFAAVVSGAVFVIGFIVFPSTTHFLGDGYQLLAQLASGTENIKAWDFGASATNQLIFGMLSGENSERALQAFRIGSAVFGFICLIFLLLLSRRAFLDTTRRILFFLSAATGGYMLMYFGYVENYAGLITAIILFTISGLMAAEGKINRLWALPSLAAALFFHLFALALLPAFLVLLFQKEISRINFARHRSAWLFGLAAAVLVLAVGYHLLRQSSYFFTFALLPLWPDQFTVDSDWLFSPKHLVDLVNLVLILVPGLPIVVAVLASKANSGKLSAPAVWFLSVLSFSSLAAVWIFNPGIGMPRNWDLFSIAGPPLAVFATWYVLHTVTQRRSAVAVTSLIIAANLLMLGPRIASQATDSVALAHFRNYLEFDPVRSRNANRLLVTYFEQKGDMATARMEHSRAEASYPESSLGVKGRELIAQGQLREGMRYLWRAIEVNPLYSDAYGNLGYCYAQMGNLDSARLMFEICDGINPNSPGSLTNLGTFYLRAKDYSQAIAYFEKALKVDSMATNAVSGMATALLSAGRYEESFTYIDRIYRRQEADASYFRQAGDAFIDKGAAAQAVKAYQYARELGLDSVSIAEIQAKNPDLRW